MLEFLEKTGEPVPGEVNAGIYVLERSVLDLIPPGRNGLDRARRLPAAGRRRALRHPARGLLDGHRHPRALPAGDLGHPRGPGRDRGRADRPRHVRRPGGRDRRERGPRPARRDRPPLPARVRGARCANRSCFDGCVVGMGARVGGSILAAGVELEAGAGREGAVVGQNERVSRLTMLDDVLAIPDHLRDALWRVESARLERGRLGRPRGLRDGRLGDRRRPRGGGARRAPRAAADDRARLPPARPGSAPSGPCSARATRARPRRRSPASRRPSELGARRIVASTGGPLRRRCPRAGRPGGRPAGDPAAAGRGRLHVRRRGRGRGAGRGGSADRRRDRRRRRAARAPGRGPARPARTRSPSASRARCRWSTAAS